MQVLSPVGRFRVRAHGLRLNDGHVVVGASLGAWKSELALEKSDLPLVMAAVGLVSAALAAAFGLGRYTAVEARGR